MKEKLAMDLAGESTTRIMALDGTTAEDVINKRNTEKLNDLIDAYSDRFEKRAANVEEFAKKVNENVNNIEIMPLGNYVLVKKFDENPFQRIVRDQKSGLIIDTGGLRPEYKNTDTGEIEQEKEFIHVGVVQEVGPECKYLMKGDAVFFPEPASIPVPFYKQQLIQINETRVLAVVNESLTERFNKAKNNG
jgi:hypothetical protein